MTNLTIRIDEPLKEEALAQAKKLGIPLTLIIKNALKNFIKHPTVVIGEVEHVDVTYDLQKKMDKIEELLVKKGI